SSEPDGVVEQFLSLRTRFFVGRAGGVPVCGSGRGGRDLLLPGCARRWSGSACGGARVVVSWCSRAERAGGAARICDRYRWRVSEWFRAARAGRFACARGGGLCAAFGLRLSRTLPRAGIELTCA